MENLGVRSDRLRARSTPSPPPQNGLVVLVAG